MSDVQVFVSYSWSIEESTGIVDEIEDLCPARNTVLIRDRNTMQYGDLIREFMDKLTGGEHIITVFSKPYFQSKWCMYELLKIWQKGEFKQRTHPVIADDCDLQNDIYRITTAKNWIRKHQELKDVLDGEDPSLFIEEFKKLNILRDIAQNVNELMNFAAGRLTADLATLRHHHYTQILDQIQPLPDPTSDSDCFDDSAFLIEVKKNLASDLKQLDIFRSQVINYCEVDFTDTTDLSGYLVEQCELGQFVQVIQNVQSATADCFDMIGETDYGKAKKLYKAAESIVSKLVLFNIKNDWMRQYRELCSEHSHHEHLLPNMAFGSVEVVMSRESHTFPEFRGNAYNLDQKGGRGIILEPGIKPKNIVRNVINRLYKRVMRQEFNNQPDEARAIEVLRETIQQRKQHKSLKFRKNYFLMLSDVSGELLADKTVQDEIKRLLPDLAFISLKSERNTQTFIAEDTAMIVAINEFFASLDEYKPHE